MSFFKAYLEKPSTQRVLKSKPGEKGFSLIELVVVIAVLAALAAIALPNFLGISDDASVRAAQTAAVNATKECQATWARGKRDVTGTNQQFYNGHTTSVPAFIDISEFAVFSTNATNGFPSAPGTMGNNQMKCFSGTNTAPAKKQMVAAPTTANKFPKFVVRANGSRDCQSGDQGSYPDTFNIGCSGASGAAGTWE